MLERREFLKGMLVVTVGGGWAVGGAQAAAATPQRAFEMFGVVRDGGPSAVRVDSAGAVKTVRIARSTTLWRDHPVALRDFIPGDEIIGYGTWANTETLIADHIESVYRPLDGTVLARDGDVLRLSSGPARFTSDSQPLKVFNGDPRPLDEITVGDHLIGRARWEPAFSGLVLLCVAVARGRR